MALTMVLGSLACRRESSCVGHEHGQLAHQPVGAGNLPGSRLLRAVARSQLTARGSIWAWRRSTAPEADGRATKARGSAPRASRPARLRGASASASARAAERALPNWGARTRRSLAGADSFEQSHAGHSRLTPSAPCQLDHGNSPRHTRSPRRGAPACSRAQPPARPAKGKAHFRGLASVSGAARNASCRVSRVQGTARRAGAACGESASRRPSASTPPRSRTRCVKRTNGASVAEHRECCLRGRCSGTAVSRSRPAHHVRG